MASYDCVEDLTRRMIFARAADIRPDAARPGVGGRPAYGPGYG